MGLQRAETAIGGYPMRCVGELRQGAEGDGAEDGGEDGYEGGTAVVDGRRGVDLGWRRRGGEWTLSRHLVEWLKGP